MNSPPAFDPILAQHAIERCAASVGLHPALPEKSHARLLERLSSSLMVTGFVEQPNLNLQIEVSPDGQFKQISNGMVPRSFISRDQSSVLTIAPDTLVWTTSSYVRWQPYVGGFERYLLPVLQQMLETVSMNAVKLEYWDRFFWTGTWDSFSVETLIRRDNEFAPVSAFKRPKEWHSHHGWFEKYKEFRRLTNVNIDVVEIGTPPVGARRPSVGIYTSLTDHMNVVGYGNSQQQELNAEFAVGQLEDQHLALKHIFGHIVTAETATRIGLFSRIAENGRS